MIIKSFEQQSWAEQILCFFQIRTSYKYFLSLRIIMHAIVDYNNSLHNFVLLRYLKDERSFAGITNFLEKLSMLWTKKNYCTRNRYFLILEMFTFKIVHFTWFSFFLLLPLRHARFPSLSRSINSIEYLAYIISRDVCMDLVDLVLNHDSRDLFMTVDPIIFIVGHKMCDYGISAFSNIQ